MSEPLTFIQVQNALSVNLQFIDSAYGPKNESPLTKEEKNQIAGKVFKDLRESFELNGEEFFAELWVVLRPALWCANWFQRWSAGEKKGELLGPWIIWSVMYRKASKLAQQRMKSKPQQIKNEMAEVLSKCGANEKFE